jgi:hypothetical protein
MVEDLVLSGNVQKLGFANGVGVSTPENPNYGLGKLPWWSDGYRAVLVFGKDQVTLSDLDYFGWEDVNIVYDEETGGNDEGATSPDEGGKGK